jgi:translocation and assembly module TamB
MKKILILVLTVVLMIAIFVGTVFYTETGLFLVKKSVNSIGSPFITIGSVKGKLSARWSLHDLEMDSPGLTVNISRVDCRLRPEKLLAGELGFVELMVKESRVTVRDKEEDGSLDSPVVLPELFIPFGFAIENVQVEELNIVEEDGGEIILIEKAGFRLSGKNHQLSLRDFYLKGTDFDLTLHGSLDFSRGWNFDLLGEYRFSGLEFEELSGTFSLNGPLDNPSVELGLHQPAAIRAAGSITHLLEDPVLNATVTGNEVNLSRICELWPEINLNTAEINLSGGIDGYHADISTVADWGDLNSIQITGSISSNWQGIEFQALSLAGENGTVTAEDSWISWTDTFRWGGRFIIKNFDPEMFTEELPGRIDAELSSQGKVVENGVEASFEIFKLEGIVHQQQIAVQGSVFLMENEVYTDGLQLKSGEFQGSAYVQQASFSWADTLNWSANISFDDFDPSVFYSELPGLISGQIVGEGQQVDQKSEGSLTLRNLSGELRGQTLNGEGNIEFRDGRLNTRGITVRHGRSKMQVSGTAGEQLSLDVTLLSPDISQLFPTAGGALSFKGRLTGTQQNPALHASLDAEDLIYGEYSISALKGDFHGQLKGEGMFSGSLQGEGIAVSGIVLSGGSVGISGSPAEHEMSIQASSGYGGLQMQARGRYSDKQWAGSLLKITLFPGKITLFPGDYGVWEQTGSASLVAGADGFKLTNLCLTGNVGELCLDGKLNTAEEDIYWQIKSSLAGGVLDWLNRWQLLPVVVSGIINGQLEAEGDSREVLYAEVQIDLPEADFEVGEMGEELRHILLDNTRFTGSLRDNRFRGVAYTAMNGGSIVQVSAEIENLGKFSLVPEQLFLTGELDLEGVDLDFLAPLTNYVLEPTGKINGSFSLSGTLNQPNADGELSIVDGGIALPDQGVILEDIHLTLSTVENGAQLSCGAASGPGRLIASGQVVYTENGILGDIGIKGEDFMLLSLPEYEIQISPDVRFLFSREKGELKGSVKIPTARITPEEMSSSVTVSNDVILINGGEEIKETAWPFYTSLDVQLGEDVQIDGYGLKGKLTGGLRVRDVPGSFLTGTGELDLIDGNFAIFGRSFDIERGRVLFTGGPIDNPGIDVRAQKRVTAEQAKGDGYVVGVDVNGLVQNLKFHLFSDPFMEDSDILAHLFVGRSLADSSEKEGSVLGAAAVALGLEGGSRIFQGVGNLLPVDDMHLEGSTEEEDMSFVVGKSITKDLYFGYDINVFSQLGVFRVRYGLTHGFSIETQTSTESTGTDILYSFEK